MSERAAQLRKELEILEEQERQEQWRLHQDQLKEIEEVWSMWQEQLRVLQSSHSVHKAKSISLFYHLKLHPYARAKSQYEPDGGFDICHSQSMSTASYQSYCNAVFQASPVVFAFVFDSHEEARASILPQDSHHRMLLTLYGVIYTITWQSAKRAAENVEKEQQHSSKSKPKTSRDLLRETVHHLRKELDMIEQAACGDRYSQSEHVACSNKTLVRYFHRFTDDNVEAEDLETAQQDIKELQNHPWSMAGTKVCDQAVFVELSGVVKSLHAVRVQHLQTEPDNATIEQLLSNNMFVQ